jgi:hypothetical protein
MARQLDDLAKSLGIQQRWLSSLARRVARVEDQLGIKDRHPKPQPAETSPAGQGARE